MEEIILNLLESYSAAAFFGAFAAGAVTAMAPCSLISVPLMVASAAAGAKELDGRKKAAFTYLFSALFAFGVVVSFSALGFLVSKFDGFMLTASTPTFLVAAAVCFLVAFYALGFFGELDKGAIVDKFIKLRLLGAFLIGIVFGLVSTPCASAPLFAIISLASSSGYAGALGLIVTFAIGHSLLLLAAGVSVGFAQTVVSNTLVSKISDALNRFFALLLIGFGVYFLYRSFF